MKKLDIKLIKQIQERNVENAIALIRQGADASTRDPESDITLLDLAVDKLYSHSAQTQKDKKLKLLSSIFELPNIRITMGNKYSALHLIAYVSENPLTLEAMKILLNHADEEALNAYDIYGKTPLLDAIEQGNEEMALLLASHPKVNPNLPFKLPENCARYLPTDCVPLVGAILTKMHRLTHVLLDRKDTYSKVLPGIYFDVPSEPLKENKSFFTSVYWRPREERKQDIYIDFTDGSVALFAALLGDLDLLIFYLKKRGVSALSDVSFSNLTMLHYACIYGHEDIAKLLLNRKELQNIFADEPLSDEAYCNFVNTVSNANNNAFSQLMAVAGRKNAAQVATQLAPYFTNCMEFRIDTRDMIGQSYLDYMLDKNLLEEIEKIIVSRGDGDFFTQDPEGTHALRRVIDSNDPNSLETLKLLVSLHNQNLCSIHPNQHLKLEPKIRKRLNEAFEESWFGEVATFKPTITLDMLFRIYISGNAETVTASYSRDIYTVDISVLSGEVSASKRELMRETARLWLEDETNAGSMNLPSLDTHEYDRDLLLHFYEVSQKIDFDPELSEEKRLNQYEFNYQGITFKVVKLSAESKYVEETAIIESVFLHNMVDKGLNESQDPPHTPLIFNLVKNTNPLYQSDKNLRLLNQEKLAVLLQIPNIDFPPDASLREIYSYATKEVKTILHTYKERSKEKDTPLKTHQTVSPYEMFSALEEIKDYYPYKNLERGELSNLLNKSPQLKDFARLLRLKLNDSASKRVIHDVQRTERRMDAFARLLEGTGVCSAVCFDGSTLFIASNYGAGDSQQDDTEKLSRQYITDVMRFFCEYAKDPNSISADTVQEILLLICQTQTFKQSDSSEIKKTITNFIHYLHSYFTKQTMPLKNLQVLCAPEYEITTEVCKALDFPSDIISEPKLYYRAKDILQLFFYFHKIIELIRDPIDDLRDFSKHFTGALRDQRYQLLQNSEKIHAEMSLLQALATNPLAPYYYIGISKLCCPNCHSFFQAVEQVAEQDNPHSAHPSKYAITVINTRGAHPTSGYWIIPKLLLNEPLFTAFLGGRNSELIHSFMKLSEPDRVNAMAIIQSHSSLSVKQVALLKLPPIINQISETRPDHSESSVHVHHQYDTASPP